MRMSGGIGVGNAIGVEKKVLLNMVQVRVSGVEFLSLVREKGRENLPALFSLATVSHVPIYLSIHLLHRRVEEYCQKREHSKRPYWYHTKKHGNSDYLP